MSVTKKHTWEPVTDISLEADKSPGDCWNNAEQRRGPSQGGPARGTPGGGSEEASGTSPAEAAGRGSAAGRGAPCSVTLGGKMTLSQGRDSVSGGSRDVPGA